VVELLVAILIFWMPFALLEAGVLLTPLLLKSYLSVVSLVSSSVASKSPEGSAGQVGVEMKLWLCHCSVEYSAGALDA
jgi:hypothetical protein